MEQKFKKTVVIEKLEGVIKRLEDDIENLKDTMCEKKRELGKFYQEEFDKQFGLIIGKTIIRSYRGVEYVYMGIDLRDYSYGWVVGSKINKNGKISKVTRTLYREWEKTGKEYNS